MVNSRVILVMAVARALRATRGEVVVARAAVLLVDTSGTLFPPLLLRAVPVPVSPFTDNDDDLDDDVEADCCRVCIRELLFVPVEIMWSFFLPLLVSLHACIALSRACAWILSSVSRTRFCVHLA